ncbi:MAG: M1 family metallopeptidase [Bacteroidales bacterium]|nr:M1 family metallopeptidase [Bacteroidales bacterium]
MEIYLNINPNVRFIDGKTVQYFHIDNNDTKLPIVFDFDKAFNIKEIKSGDKNLDFEFSNNKIKIYPKSNWNTFDSVSIKYSGEPPVSGFGSVVFTNHKNVPIFWTLSDPFGAKDWFPCKQVLTDKYDSLKTIISCPKEYKSASNGIIIKENIKDDYRTTEWLHHYPCAYYLIAVAISNYEVFNNYVKLSDNDSILIQNFAYPENINSAKRNVPKLIPAFKMFCDTFGLYPFDNEKYGQAQFGWSGGMEHQTITFLNSFSIDLMVHELAHQWFGNTVTHSNWHDIWISEGFAEYCELLACEKGCYSYNSPKHFRENLLKYICTSTHGSVYVSDTTDVNSIFNLTTTYYKGAMILHALRKELGDDIFFPCLREYYNTYKFKNVSVKDFIKFVSDFSKQDFQWFFEQWYYGKGFPIYKIDWKNKSSKQIVIKINQTQTDESVKFFRSKLTFKLTDKENHFQYITVNNIKNNQEFNIKTNFYVTDIEFDPENDLIKMDNNL